jgi:hypothetical protein
LVAAGLFHKEDNPTPKGFRDVLAAGHTWIMTKEFGGGWLSLF